MEGQIRLSCLEGQIRLNGVGDCLEVKLQIGRAKSELPAESEKYAVKAVDGSPDEF